MLTLYKFLTTYEFEIRSIENEIRGRVTLLQSVADSHKFRIYVSMRDLFSLRISSSEKKEAMEYSDEVIWPDRPLPRLADDDFEAESVSEAEEIVIARIQEFQEHLLAPEK